MKRIVFLAVFVLSFAGMANAQFFKLGVKLSYGSKDIANLIDSAQTVATNPTSEFLMKCNGGLFLRLNLGNHLYLQPEANFAIASLSSTTDSNTSGNNSASFIANAANTIKNVESLSLSIPVLVGWKIFEVENTINMRLFLGPEFYGSANSLKDIDFNTYSAVAGVGFDLLDFLYVDARATYTLPINKDSFIGSTTVNKEAFFYNISVGLLF